ncbi:BofC C-terminal domain-containing protein [Paenibacillus sp. UNC451MF]|uniref:BofC C-terminal domain-containing protein n=1 Tax=Paenibacillus sp. UNC451MF TaxID=1449063 RepID=UPI000491C9A6|nr:BofC C-terminal domain-containing protein [Paenibacillus sp. UNC451MF]
MILLSLLNKIKKKLRWKRRWLTLAAVVLIAGMSSLTLILLKGSSSTDGLEWSSGDQPVFGTQIRPTQQPEDDVQAMVKHIVGQRGAYAKKAYVCGEELQMLGRMTAAQILQYHKEHPALTVSIGEGGDVYFTEQIDDLSPQCKNNAYFGLDAKGNLSLFEGVPGSNQVLRTFFQLNIEFLESSLPRETVKQLYRGIPVNNLDEYNSVLSTFADFAVEEPERALH